MKRYFHTAGAVSPEAAASLGQVGVRDSLVFRYLRSRGVIVGIPVLAVGLVAMLVLFLFAMSRAAETPSAR